VPLVSLSVAPSFPRARVAQVNTIMPHRLRLDPYPHPRTAHIPIYILAVSIFSIFHPNSFAVFASESDSASDSDSDSDLTLTADDPFESLSSVDDVDSSSLFPRQPLHLVPSPFASLDLPPDLSLAYKVSYHTHGLPVTVPLPFSPPRSVNPLSTALASFAVLSALLPSSKLWVHGAAPSARQPSLPEAFLLASFPPYRALHSA
jgi:hypothetical protein